MMCPKCGTELPDGVKFCPNCGCKTDDVNEQPQSSSSPGIIPVTNSNIQVLHSNNSVDNSVKAKLLRFWNGLTAFSKIAAIATAIVIILLIIAICTKTAFAIVFSVIQLAGLIVAVLMDNDIIVLQQRWVKCIVLAAAILFSILNIASYSWGKGNNKPNNPPTSSQPQVSDTPNSDAAPVDTSVIVPFASSECIGKDYSDIKSDFSSAGFEKIKIEAAEDLQSTEADKVNTVETVSINGKTDFEQGQKFDKNDEVIITYHAYQKYNVMVKVDFPSNLIFSRYDVKLLVNGLDKGTMTHGEGKDYEFALEPDEYTLTFENVDNSNVKGEVTLTVDCDVEASYKISCYNDKVTVETVYVDRLAELGENEAKLDVASSEYKYGNYDDVKAELEKLGFTNIKSEALYDIVFGITPNGEVEGVSIAGNGDFKRGDVFAKDAEVIITYHMPEADNPNNITMTTSSSDYMDKNYADVEKALRDLGFTNVETETLTTNNSDEDGKVFSITIGGSAFKSGDVFPPNRTVSIMYFAYEKPKPVYYSTNDYETATKGNTGVYSYIGKGKLVDVYWIIDFDEGYVYQFTDENGIGEGDRARIESGDLNSSMIVTYHDYGTGDVWSYNFHFKYANVPTTLVLVDNDGFVLEYQPTNLEDALKKLSTKSIMEL